MLVSLIICLIIFRLNRVQDIFQSKWEKVISKFSASKNDTCKGTEKKDVTKKKQKHSKKTSNSEDKSEKEVKRKDYSSWSKKETLKRGNSTSNSGERKKRSCSFRNSIFTHFLCCCMCPFHWIGKRLNANDLNTKIAAFLMFKWMFIKWLLIKLVQSCALKVR